MAISVSEDVAYWDDTSESGYRGTFRSSGCADIFSYWVPETVARQIGHRGDERACTLVRRARWKAFCRLQEFLAEPIEYPLPDFWLELRKKQERSRNQALGVPRMAISGGEFIEMEPEDLRSLTEELRQMGPEGLVSWHEDGRECYLRSVGCNMGTLLMSRVDDPQDWGIVDCRPGWSWSDWLGFSLAVFAIGCGVVALWFPIPLVLRLLFLASCLGLAGVVLLCLEVFDRWPPELWLMARDRWLGMVKPFYVGRNPRSYLEHAHDYA